LAYPHSTRSGRAWPSRLPLAGEPPRTARAACRSWPGLGRCTLDRSKQQGRRFPRSILEMLASTRRCRVAWFLVAWTQRTHSHRASGVMSSHTSRILAGAAARAAARSSGTSGSGQCGATSTVSSAVSPGPIPAACWRGRSRRTQWPRRPSGCLRAPRHQAGPRATDRRRESRPRPSSSSRAQGVRVRGGLGFSRLTEEQ